MKNIIVDLDGTLANCDHRVHHVRKTDPDWDSFWKGCKNDLANTWCVSLISAMINAGFHVFVVSARSRHTEVETVEWFRDHNLIHPQISVILVRAFGDSTPDQELKRAWLKGFEHRDETAFVVDDRQKVVDMWRQEGMTCLQCYSWPEFSTRAPRPSEDMVTV